MSSSKRRSAIEQELEELEAPLVPSIDDEPDDLLDRDDDEKDDLLDRDDDDELSLDDDILEREDDGDKDDLLDRDDDDEKDDLLDRDDDDEKDDLLDRDDDDEKDDLLDREEAKEDDLLDRKSASEDVDDEFEEDTAGIDAQVLMSARKAVGDIKDDDEFEEPTPTGAVHEERTATGAKALGEEDESDDEPESFEGQVLAEDEFESADQESSEDEPKEEEEEEEEEEDSGVALEIGSEDDEDDEGIEVGGDELDGGILARSNDDDDDEVEPEPEPTPPPKKPAAAIRGAMPAAESDKPKEEPKKSAASLRGAAPAEEPPKKSAASLRGAAPAEEPPKKSAASLRGAAPAEEPPLKKSAAELRGAAPAEEPPAKKSAASLRGAAPAAEEPPKKSAASLRGAAPAEEPAKKSAASLRGGSVEQKRSEPPAAKSKGPKAVEPEDDDIKALLDDDGDDEDEADAGVLELDDGGLDLPDEKPSIAPAKKAEAPKAPEAMKAPEKAPEKPPTPAPALEMDSGLDDLDADALSVPVEYDDDEPGQVAFDAQITPLRVIFGCAMQKSSGALRFKGPAGGFKFHFVDGGVVEVATNVEKLGLPAFLLDNEVCDEATIKKAEEAVASEGFSSVQAAIIKKNLAPAAGISRATVLWAKMVLGEVIRIDAGTCHFAEGKVQTPHVPLALGAWSAPIDAVRAGFLKRDFERRLGPLMEKAVRTNPEFPVTLDDLGLQAAEKTALSSIDGSKTIKQLLEASKADQAVQMATLRSIFLGIESALLVTGSARELAQMSKAKEILAQYEQLKEKDEYDILGVPRTANAQVIRGRIQELKKIYAADPEGEILALQEAKSQLFSLFERAVKAFSARKDELNKPRVLARPVSVMERTRSVVPREVSISAAADGSPAVVVEDNRSRAKKMFEQAEAAAKKGSYKEAIEKLDRATEIDGDRKTYYKVHQTYYKCLGDKTDRLAAAKEGIKEIEATMIQGQQVAEGWVLIGRLYKFARDKEGSSKAFEKALGLDPNNQEAKTEVNMAQRRGLSSAEVLAANSKNPASSAFSFLKKKLEETSQKTGIKLPTLAKKDEPKKKDDKRKAAAKKSDDDEDDIP